jgi:DNA primase
MTEKETYFLIKKYGARVSKLNQDITVRLGSKVHRLPSGVSPLSESHKRYLLEKRNFDPDQLEKDWKLLSTGPVSMLDHLNYKHRILIPYIWEGKEVSFDTRDVTDQALSKYMACPKSREIVSHKEIIYGKQEAWTDKLICVEGTTDVWRFGFNSGAVSGIKFTPKQVKELAKFKRVPVCFDGGESQAIHQANRLVSELKFRGVDSFRVDIEGDPGSMKQSEADYLVKQLIK